ncbi:MAG: hypothetical protein HY481_01875 [Candidatus Vogelbacteria bacterium]|nr:hypothetical protein [Candidatus Vogelbacteria bacterium]
MSYRTLLMAGAIWIGLTGFANAQGMMNANQPTDDHTATEEAAGLVIWQKLQNKEVACQTLTGDDFGALGEYFMGQMLETSHGLMNQMITQMHGEAGEEAMHVALGKRLSGCDPQAVFAPGAFGFMPMMNMGFGLWDQTGGGMMGSGPGSWGNFGGGNFGLGGTLFIILWWIIFIVGVIAIVKWLVTLFQSKNKNNSN